MAISINKDFYCSADRYENLFCRGSGLTCCANRSCPAYHRKHPTPEQYKEEYGQDVPENMPVWGLDRCYYKDGGKKWLIALWQTDKYFRQEDDARFESFVVACTPFGKPDDNWRPQ